MVTTGRLVSICKSKWLFFDKMESGCLYLCFFCFVNGIVLSRSIVPGSVVFNFGFPSAGKWV